MTTANVVNGTTAAGNTTSTTTAPVGPVTGGGAFDGLGVFGTDDSNDIMTSRFNNTLIDTGSGLSAWIWLVIVAIVMSVAFAAVSFYVLVYFQHEEDKNTAWIPKIVLLVGMWLSMAVILMLPLDIANADVQGALPMEILWQVVLVVAIVWSVLVIPFAQLYYEGEDPTNAGQSQLGQALKVMIVGGVIFGVLAVVGYLLLGFVNVPVHDLSSLPIDSTASRVGPIVGGGLVESDGIVEFRISIVLFLVSMLTLVGTFFLACFGGIGLAALPLDLINEFRFRPTRLTLEEYARAKLQMGKRATTLLDAGKLIQEEQRMRKSRGRQARATFNRFKHNVYLLDEDWRKLSDAHKNRAGRVLWSYAQLALGCGGALLSLLWSLQIVLFVLPRTPGANVPTPVFDVLGDFFVWLDRATALPIATALYALFAFYMLACVMKGNFKFGLRVFIIFTIHPMRLGGTMLNSFLFNVGLILLTSLALVQFCTNAFLQYAQFAAAAELFGVAVQKLRYIEYFFYFYSAGMVGIAVLTLLALLIWPTARRINTDEA